MAKTSAYQLQKADIRVNSICPGLIETGMTTFTFEYARQRGSASKIGQLNPLGRFGVAEGIVTPLILVFDAPDDDGAEIANAVLFLASGMKALLLGRSDAHSGINSDDSSYVNGQNFAVDGGLSASHPVVPGRWA